MKCFQNLFDCEIFTEKGKGDANLKSKAYGSH